MANEYDNTDRGAAFGPFPTQSMILQGKLNDRGEDLKVVLVKDETRSGKKIIEVYQKVGVLFENDKKGNENAPDYTGPLVVNAPKTLETRRLAAWRKMKDGKPYMTFSASDNQSQQEQQTASDPLHGDKVPF